MTNQNLLNETIAFVKKELENAEGGHDWFHIERVYKNAALIANGENCDILIVQLGALLHSSIRGYHPIVGDNTMDYSNEEMIKEIERNYELHLRNLNRN
jgi:HD superfamily phosphodiesterase